MSRHLTDRSIDHVLLERGEVANSWRDGTVGLASSAHAELAKPAARLCLRRRRPGRLHEHVRGRRLSADAMPIIVRAPVQTGTRVTRVSQDRRRLRGDDRPGAWRCQTLVIASGACNIATVPSLADGLPRIDRQPHADGLPQSGGVAGRRRDDRRRLGDRRAACRARFRPRAATSCSSAGEHVRVPRVYRGRDIKWWMDVIGAMDMRYDEVDDLKRARGLPSLQLIGTPERALDRSEQPAPSGVEIVGRLVGLRDGKAQFSGSLAKSVRAGRSEDEPAADKHRRVGVRKRAGRQLSPRHAAIEPTDIGTQMPGSAST